MEETKVHVFETAGLGKAPFRVVGVEIRKGPIEYAPGCFAGAPGQPMSTCAFCGTGIAECWQVKSSDNKTFVVGCDCVAKTGDSGLKKAMNYFKLEMRHKAEDARIEKAKELVNKGLVKATLCTRPHPYPFMADKGLTLFDFCEWMLKNAGRSGQIKAARAIDRVIKNQQEQPDDCHEGSYEGAEPELPSFPDEPS